MKEFNYVKKGYDPAEVDEYIKRLEEVLKSYKDKDASIKNAILSAQIAADNLILNAENQAEEIRTAANEGMEQVLQDSLIMLKEINESVDGQRKFVDGFKQEYNVLVNKYLRITNIEAFKQINERIDKLDLYLQKVISGIESQGYSIPEQEAIPIPEEIDLEIKEIEEKI